MPRRLPKTRFRSGVSGLLSGERQSAAGTQSGAGFLGAVVLGLAIGYSSSGSVKSVLAKLYNRCSVHADPVRYSAGFRRAHLLRYRPVMSDLMGGLLHFLNTIPPS